jgi:hypothetical protein
MRRKTGNYQYLIACLIVKFIELEKELFKKMISDLLEYKQIIDLQRPVSIPSRNSDRVIGELSCRNELPDAFLDRFGWLEPLQEKILQSGQHFCCSSPTELLKSARDMWQKFPG